MYQSNNIKNEVKSSSYIKRTILIIVIAIIVFGSITAYLIYNKLQGTPIFNNDKSKIVNEDKLKINSLSEMYTPNPLKINDEKFEAGPIITTDWSSYHKLRIDYISISGLKNKNIQDKINKEIKDTVMGLYTQQDIDNKSIQSISIWAYVEANYGDVLSIYIGGSKYMKDNSADTIDVNSLNYRLDTGEKIKFEDLFVSGTSINNILASSFYKYLASTASEPGQEDMQNVDMDKVDTSKYEDQMLDFVNKYQDSKNVSFYFNNSNIWLQIPNTKYSVFIDMSDFYDQIAIYKRFKIDGLYDGSEATPKKQFVFTNLYNRDVDVYAFGSVYDNLFIDFELHNYYEKSDVLDKIDKNVYYIMDQKIKEVKDLANDNPNKGYIVKATYSIDKEYGSSNYQLDVSAFTNEMTKKYYSSKATDLIAEALRQPYDGGYDGNYFYGYDVDSDDGIIGNRNITIISYTNKQYYDANGDKTSIENVEQ